MCCDNGTKEIGHVGYAFLLSFSSSYAPLAETASWKKLR